MRDGYLHQRRYCGTIKAIIVDWAGTVVDYGSRAPAGVFVEVFRRQGVVITTEEARVPMGMEKRDHIRALLAMPAVAERWVRAHAAASTAADVDRMYDAFLPLQLECLPQYADLVPGTLGIVAACRGRGMKIGSSTGYSRALMDVLVPEARRRGFEPEAVVCADDVPAGRPAPWMCLANLQRLGVWPVEAAIVVDDTAPGIEAGLNAGMWTVGVAESGNEMGLSREEVAALNPAEHHVRVRRAYERLYRAGAHYVINSIADLLPVIESIERRLEAGEKP